MAIAEFVAKITGDTSGLEHALQEVKGSMRKLSKDEVIVKLDYDGNVKGFNEEFAKIQKECPDLNIQFQYNVNQKLLNKEKDKLKQLKDLKFDVDTGNADKKIASMITALDNAVSAGESSDIVSKKIKDIYRYANTIKSLGGTIRTNYEEAIFKSVEQTDYVKVFNHIFDGINVDGIRLINLKQPIEEEINATENRISDFQDFLSKLEKKGASKNGLSSELEDVQEEIKILRSNLEEMKTELNGVTGDAFRDMTEQISNMNDQLSTTIERFNALKKISLGQTISKWQERGYADKERFAPYNSATKQVSTSELVGESDRISGEIIKKAISESDIAVDGLIHTHPRKNGVFGKADIEKAFSLLTEGITKQAVAGYESVMELDLTQVNTDKSDDILTEIRQKYDEVDNNFHNKFSEIFGKEAQQIGNAILNSNTFTDTSANEILSEFKKNFNAIFDEGIEAFSLNEFVTKNKGKVREAMNKTLQSDQFDKLPEEVQNAIYVLFNNIEGDIVNHVIDMVSDHAEDAYSKILSDVFSNDKYLKKDSSGNAIKVSSITDFKDQYSLDTDVNTKSIDELNQKFENLSQQIKETRDLLREVVELVNTLSTNKPTSSLKDLESFFNSLGKPTFTNGSLDNYLTHINTSFDSLDEKSKALLKNLGLLNSDGGITPIIDGANNYGGLIGEKNTAIVRQGANIENTKKLKQALDEAYAAGINCSRIIDIIETADGKVIELQNTIKGNPLQDSDFNFNIDGIKASDDQIRKLYSDVKKLWELGIAVDLENPSNLIYDETKGFQLIDLDFIDHAKLQFKSFEELWGAFVENIKGNAEDLKTIGDSDIGNQLDSFASKIAQAGKRAGDAYDEGFKGAIGAHSPADDGIESADDYADGVIQETNRLLPEFESAGRKAGERYSESFNDEIKNGLGDDSSIRAKDLKQLREQYHILRNINNDINVRENPDNYIKDSKGRKSFNGFGLTKTGLGLEELKKFKAEILELNPSLQRVADSTERISKTKFNEMFKDVFVSNIERIGQEFQESSQQANSATNQIREGLEEVAEAQRELTEARREAAKSSPTQQFDNEVQKNLVMLENYENTIKEIDKLKVNPETDEAKRKIQELNKLADYFASQITVIKSENGHEVNASMMYFNGVPNNNLMKNYNTEDIERFARVAKERAGLNRDNVPNEFFGIEEELNRIELASEGLRNALTKDLSASKAYVSRVKADLINLVDTYEELKHVKEGSRDYEAYQKDIEVYSKRSPEILQFLDKIKTYDQAKAFVNSDEWNDFLATLPEAHTYLESIGYDFERLNQKSSENNLSSGTNRITEQARAEMQAEEAAYDAAQRVKVEAERAGQAIAESQNKAQSEITDTTTLLHGLSELLHNLSRNNLKIFNSSHDNIFGELNEDNIESVYQRLEMIKNVISKTMRNDYTHGDNVVGGILDDNSLVKYNAYKELLEKIGYTLGEFKEGGMGWQADIVPISDKAIHNGEEMARILFDIQKYEQVSNGTVIPEVNESVLKAQSEAATRNWIEGFEEVEAKAGETKKAIQNMWNVNEADSTIDLWASELHKVEEEAEKVRSKQAIRDNNIEKKRSDVNNVKVNTEEGIKYSEELQKRIDDVNSELTTLKEKLDSITEPKLKEWNSEFEALKSKVKGVNQDIAKENKNNSDNSLAKSKRQYINLLKEENDLQVKLYESQKRNDETVDTTRINERLKAIQQEKQQLKETLEVQEQKSFVIQQNYKSETALAEAKFNVDKKIATEEEALQKRRLSLLQQITQWLKSNPIAEKKYGSLLADGIAKLNSNAKITPDILKQIETEFKNIKLEATSAGDTGVGFFTMLKRRWQALGTYLGSFVSFYRIIAGVRQAFSTITELDTQLVDLRKTTKMNTDELNEFYFSANQVAKQMGVTTSEIISQAAAWSRLNKIGHLCGNI